MTSPRRSWRSALALSSAGLVIAAAAQLVAPLPSPPLYDGVVVADPYAWVRPPAGQRGGAQAASSTFPIVGHQSPLVAVATTESPPQAQVVAMDGTLVIPRTATSLIVTISPLDPGALPADPRWTVLGNVYRIRVVDQSGVPATAPVSAAVTVVLRAPRDAADGRLGLFADGAWSPLHTDVGVGSTFDAIVTGFGDFAVIVPRGVGGPAGSIGGAAVGTAIAGGSGATSASGVVPGSATAASPVSATTGPTVATTAPTSPSSTAGSNSSLEGAIAVLAVVAAAVVAFFSFRRPAR